MVLVLSSHSSRNAGRPCMRLLLLLLLLLLLPLLEHYATHHSPLQTHLTIQPRKQVHAFACAIDDAKYAHLCTCASASTHTRRGAVAALGREQVLLILLSYSNADSIITSSVRRLVPARTRCGAGGGARRSIPADKTS